MAKSAGEQFLFDQCNHPRIDFLSAIVKHRFNRACPIELCWALGKCWRRMRLSGCNWSMPRLEREIAGPDRLPSNLANRGMDAVLKLPHVAGPIVLLEQFDCFRS